MNSLANRTGNKFAITGRLIRDNRECFPVAREALGPCLRVVFVGRLAALSRHRARIAERARRLPQEISCQARRFNRQVSDAVFACRATAPPSAWKEAPEQCGRMCPTASASPHDSIQRQAPARLSVAGPIRD